MIDRRKLRLIIVAVVAVIILLCIYTAATHGRLVIRNLGDEEVSIVKITDKDIETTETISNGAFVGSGEYVVKNNKDSHERLITVRVENWFRTTSITYDELKTAATKRVAALTYEHLVPLTDGSFASYTDLNSYSDGYSLHPANDPFGGKVKDIAIMTTFASPVSLNDGRLVGVVDDTLSAYSFQTQKITPYSTIKIPPAADDILVDPPSLQRSSDVGDQTIGILQVNDSKPLTMVTASGTTNQYTVKGEGDLKEKFDINQAYAANLFESRKINDAKNNEAEDIPSDYRVVVSELATQTSTTVSVGTAKSISAVTIDSSGEYIAVIKDDYLYIYHKDGSLVAANPFTVANQLFWRQGKLYVLSTDVGISVFDPATTQLSPISTSTSGTLSFSNAAIYSSGIYVTAYSKKEDSKLPDGYVIDLAAASSQDEVKLAENLPYEGTNFDMNYLNDTVYIRLDVFARDETTQTFKDYLASVEYRAREKLKSLIGS
ncbi:MAG TPA: hypothetical protein VF597_02895, partial [Candidatus Saccharimonadales bacterium]